MAWCPSGRSCEPWESVFAQNSWSTCGTGRPVRWCGWGRDASCWPARWTHDHRCDTCAPSPPEEEEIIETTLRGLFFFVCFFFWCNSLATLETPAANCWEIMRGNGMIWKNRKKGTSPKLTLASHTSQNNLLLFKPTLWVSVCCFRWCDWMNSMPHSLQMYGRMSLCFIMWFWSWLGYWNVFWHSEHLQVYRFIFIEPNGELKR